MSVRPAVPDRMARDAMRTAEKPPTMYVVYQAALFDGWEVVTEHGGDAPILFDTREQATAYAKTRAAMNGGGVVKLENWFGDTEGILEVPAQMDRSLAPITS
jgi:Uncharacterized protein conserved in bacteria (DUF2188)